MSYFVDAADILGVPKSVAAIYGICFASPEPLSFTEIDERLDISSGSISQGLRILRDAGALKTVGQEEDDRTEGVAAASCAYRGRLARYEPDLELRRLVSRWIEGRLEKQLSSGATRLQAIMASIPPAMSDSATRLPERFQSLQTWHQKAGALLPLAKGFLKLA